MDNNTKKTHSLSLKNREYIEMDGIKEVISFTENKIVLKTSQGLLDIKGKKLNISKLNLDDTIIEISGKIESLIYNEKTNNSKNLFKKIFK